MRKFTKIKLKIMIGSKDPDVRVEVARSGYYLDKLINDEDPGVRATVVEMMKKY